MKPAWKYLSGLAFILLLVMVFILSPQRTQVARSNPAAQDARQDVIVGELAIPSISPALRDLPPVDGSRILLDREINPRQNKKAFLEGNVVLPEGGPDPLLEQSFNKNGFTPPAGLGFDGVTYATGGTGSPPDTVGDVGPNHYVQMVNGSIQIFNKSGTTLSGPVANNTLWSGFGGSCQTRNDGDPIVLYDPLADRWMLSQFTTASPYMICVAVSTTPDPTGTYYRYGFNVGSELADYFKFGVWPNAYYMSANEGSYTAYAFDRTKMLAGQAATFVKFSGQTNLLMPADVDGAAAPPAGAPGYFYTFKDNTYSGHGGGVDRLEIFELNPNFTTPASSTFTKVTDIPVASFTYTVCNFFVLSCVPQSGTTAKVDAMSEWPMFRLAYRNFGSHQAMVGNFTVDVGSDRAGIRWFELRKTTGAWSLFQEGTYAPGTEHRFNGSIAQDRNGNIALGYTASSSSLFPAVRYATRLTTDPLGTLQTEATMQAGGGSQTSSHSRWGDYSAMSVDPADDCTFWFTTEYYSTSGSSWKTRIGNFKLPECTTGPTPTPTNTPTPGTPTATPTVTNTPLPSTCTTFASTDVPKSISASGTPSVASILNISGSGTITDLNLKNLNGTHTWINDLDFTLQSPAGTSVQVMARSCSSEDNFALNLDDEAAAGAWPCPPVGGGTYQPSSPLSSFDGQNANGTWTLTVRDNAASDGGSLNGWSLEVCTTGGGGPTPTPTNTPTPTPTQPPILDTGFLSPSANAAVTTSSGDNNGFEGTAANAYSDNATFASDTNSGTSTATTCTSTAKDKHLYYNYNFAIPGSATIRGVEIRLDGRADSTASAPRFCVQLSWDGGTTWTTAKTSANLTTSEATYILGTATDTWGRTWTPANFANTSLRVRIIPIASSTARDFFLDWIAARVTYQ